MSINLANDFHSVSLERILFICKYSGQVSSDIGTSFSNHWISILGFVLDHLAFRHSLVINVVLLV